MALSGPLAQLVQEPRRAAVLLDVDGTLAPIVARPEDAEVPAETRQALVRLVERYAFVACVSGRPGADAARIVGVQGIVYVGEHGFELEPAAQEWAERLRELTSAVAWPAERKRLTASFHYREAADEEAARAELELVAQRARDAGFRTRWGRKVLELVPPLDADKGTAVRRLLGERGLVRALYAGDDTTDLDAFAAVAGLEVGVAVAVASPESPPRLLEAANVIVQGPAGFRELLRLL